MFKSQERKERFIQEKKAHVLQHKSMSLQDRARKVQERHQFEAQKLLQDISQKLSKVRTHQIYYLFDIDKGKTEVTECTSTRKTEESPSTLKANRGKSAS